ncbi:uncharacterized protein LOC129727844 isoform X2 [Wyeomyia smithii]|uniref:uncharacterized protein LOC129727844 isoform X2 n=1 Tax=Wyeomyia smithii TaxID=174621 RepID=UPI002467B489|nr:uncharacterized protein LOC129727844 isoform X2 [Wyeomyia smithii]
MEDLITMALTRVVRTITKMFSKKTQPLAQPDFLQQSEEDSSFDLDDSFQAMIEKKRQQLIKAKEDESKASEEISSVSQFTGGGDNTTRCLGNDSTIIEPDSMFRVTDESFEEMERLCSMEQSRLLIDLHVPQHAGEETSLRNIEECSRISEPLETLCKNATLNKEPEQNEVNITIGMSDETQLDDIEEPSCMWEQSIIQGNAGKALSPVKRVHMLRPSTIIEEPTTINETTVAGAASKNTSLESSISTTINKTTAAGSASKNTSLESYISAKQTLNGSDNCSAVTESEVYRTAEEGNESKSSAPNSTVDSAVGFDITVNKTSLELNTPLNEVTVIDDESECEQEDDSEDIIVLSSSSDSETENGNNTLQKKESKFKPLDSFNNSGDLQEDSLCGEDSVTENDVGSVSLDAIPDHFNDTLEEMDFMMRQGMKIMQQQKTQQLQGQSTSLKTSIKKTVTASQQKSPFTPANQDRYLKPVQQPTYSCKQIIYPNSANKIYSAQKSATSSAAVDSSSGGLFKKPTVSRFPLPKSAKKFDHIVSPIGAYINRTPHTTLQSQIFIAKSNLIDVLHSNPENRESTLSAKENHSLSAKVDPSTYSSSLPRKGVVSSRGAHVLDERHAVRIPGGEKVHKLLNNSPTMVIRHEGRLKYQREPQLTDESIAEDSLADLSMISGDVSVRVLKDVRRF